MKITRKQLRLILLENLLLENRQTRNWINNQPEADRPELLAAYNEGLRDTSQLSWIQKTRGTEPISDLASYVKDFFDPQVQSIIKGNGFETNLSVKTYPTSGSLKSVVDQANNLIKSRKEKESNTAVDPINDPEHVDTIGTVGPWTILMPKTIQGSIACDRTGLETTWCTTKRSGQNMFISYVGREDSDIILFYVMDYNRAPDDAYAAVQEACLNNNDSRICVGFVNGSPQLEGIEGGLSVDAANKGLTEEILRTDSGFGQYYDQILNTLTAEAQVIGSNHPAKESLKRSRTDLLYLKSVIKDYEKDAKSDYIKQVSKNLEGASPDVVKFILFSDPGVFYDTIRGANSDNPKVEFITRSVLEKIYNEFSTKKTDTRAIFDGNMGGSMFASDLLIFDVIIFKGYLMSEDLFYKFFDLYNELLDERLVQTGQMRPGTVIDTDVRMNRILKTSLSHGRRIPLNPIVTQKIHELQSRLLSPEGIQRSLDNGFPNSPKDHFSAASDDLKEKFYEREVSSRFEHVLKTFRYLMEEGADQFTLTDFENIDLIPVLDQKDGIALSIVQKELTNGYGSRDPNHVGFHPKLVQDVEETFTSVFPEFYQMNWEQFNSFLKGVKGKNDAMIGVYIKEMDLEWLAGTWKNNYLRNNKNSVFQTLISKLSQSPFISEKMANHFKNNMCMGYVGFLLNRRYSDDQYLVDLYRPLRQYIDLESPKIPDNQYTISIPEDEKNLVAKRVYSEIEDRAYFSVPPRWTLGEDILQELGIEKEDY